jgi:hypothetical protein
LIRECIALAVLDSPAVVFAQGALLRPCGARRIDLAVQYTSFNINQETLMKISKKLAFGASAAALLATAVVQAAGFCDSTCAQNGQAAYDQVMRQYPSTSQCNIVPDQYKEQCYTGTKQAQAEVVAAAQNAYNSAYYSCIQYCHN